MKAILRLDSPPVNRTATGHRWLAGFEWLFLLVGLAALDTYVWVNASSLLSQAYQDWSFDQTLRGLRPSIPAFMADEIPAAGMLRTAANAIDEAAAALANCGCR